MAGIWRTTTVYKKYLKIKDVKPNEIIKISDYVPYKFKNFKVITFLKAFEFNIENVIIKPDNYDFGDLWSGKVDMTYKLNSKLVYDIAYVDDNSFKIVLDTSNTVNNSVLFDVIVIESDVND